jgi:hypothetical protein
LAHGREQAEGDERSGGAQARAEADRERGIEFLLLWFTDIEGT